MYPFDMRVLGRIRLSRITEESTSAARQREIIQQWSDMNDHQIVGWAEDLDVSGSIDPFETPALGPWLAEDRRDEWDILVSWKLDRVGRRAIPLNRLFGWMLEHDKTLVCVNDNIDLSTWVGRLVANVIAGVAEGELEAIRERTKAGRQAVLRAGRWPGGPTPYGLRPARADVGARLEIVPEQAEVIHRIVREVCAGSSIEAVANRLNEDGVPSPKNGEWLPSTLWKIVTAKYLLGHATYEGNTVYDAEGRPVLNADPILTQDEWDDLQAAVAARRVNYTVRSKTTSPLHGVVYCLICDLPMFHKRMDRPYGKRHYRYYHCRDKQHGVFIDAEQVESAVEDTFIHVLGDVTVKERAWLPAEDHELEREEAERAIDDISALLGTMTSETVRSRLSTQLAALDSRLRELEGLPSREARWEYRETGQTYADAWREADTEERRQLLLRSGITAAVHVRGKTRNSGGAWEFEFRIPDAVKSL
ncbi:putative integrase [Mycobacterium phage PP]|uniref:Putative integrase n=1 Tax=Mycobacterium phage PP TaxID=2077134 RepID=A0A2Z5XVG5_9CAUD|nr:integrase [Mycobacterium phage PP]BBC53835.1 putative integrase [Mycobacterium phage PP]